MLTIENKNKQTVSNTLCDVFKHVFLVVGIDIPYGCSTERDSIEIAYFTIFKIKSSSGLTAVSHSPDMYATAFADCGIAAPT